MYIRITHKGHCIHVAYGFHHRGPTTPLLLVVYSNFLKIWTTVRQKKRCLHDYLFCVFSARKVLPSSWM